MKRELKVGCEGVERMGECSGCCCCSMAWQRRPSPLCSTRSAGRGCSSTPHRTLSLLASPRLSCSSAGRCSSPLAPSLALSPSVLALGPSPPGSPVPRSLRLPVLHSLLGCCVAELAHSAPLRLHLLVPLSSLPIARGRGTEQSTQHKGPTSLARPSFLSPLSFWAYPPSPSPLLSASVWPRCIHRHAALGRCGVRASGRNVTWSWAQRTMGTEQQQLPPETLPAIALICAKRLLGLSQATAPQRRMIDSGTGGGRV